MNKLVAGNEKFLVILLGALQTLLAADTFGLGDDINQALIALIVPMQGWLTANTLTAKKEPTE